MDKMPKIPKEKKRKITKFLLIIIAIIIVIKLIVNYIEPVFQTMCEEKAKSIATIIANEESTKIMNLYKYEDLFTMMEM